MVAVKAYDAVSLKSALRDLLKAQCDFEVLSGGAPLANYNIAQLERVQLMPTSVAESSSVTLPNGRISYVLLNLILVRIHLAANQVPSCTWC